MKIFKNNFIVKFTVALFLIGVLIGFIYFFVNKPDVLTLLENFKDSITTAKQNTFLSSITIISIIFVSSIAIIGLPIIVFVIFYEGLSIGFTLAAFLSAFSVKGALFYTLFLVFSKIVFIAALLYFSVLSLRYIIKFIDSLISKRRDELYKTIVYHFYRFLIVIGFVLIDSIFIYFVSNKVLSIFINLI